MWKTDDEERSRGDAEIAEFPVSFNITKRRKTVEQEETERTEEAALDSFCSLCLLLLSTSLVFFSASSAPPREPVLTRDARTPTPFIT
jgi:hypothetical protein